MSVQAAPSDLRMGPLEWAYMLLLAGLWGGSFVFIEIALPYFGPLTIAAIRVTLGAIFLCSMCAVQGLAFPVGLTLWLTIAGVALCSNVLTFALIGFGQREIDAGLAAILFATSPLFGAGLAQVMTPDERLNWRKAGGLTLGLCGVAVLMGPAALASLGPGGEGVIGQAAVLGAAGVYALGGLLGRRLKGLPPMVNAACMLIAATFMAVPAAYLVEGPLHPAPSMEAIAAVGMLGFVGTGVAFIFFFHILKVAGATNVLLVTFLNPVSAMILAALLIGEPITPVKLGGFCLVLAGLVVVDGRVFKRKRAPAPD